MTLQGVLTIAILVAATGCSPRDVPNENKVSNLTVGSEIDAVIGQLAHEPQFVWLGTLARLYPDQYAIVQHAMRTQAARGSDIIETRIALAEVLKPIMQRHKKTVLSASDKLLVEYLKRNTRVAETLLTQDTKACTDVFNGNLDPKTELPDSTWKLMSESTAQLLIAAHTADVRPQGSGKFRLTQEDYQTWRIGMERVGADESTFLLLADPARKAAASDEEKCRVRVQMMRGALGLPDHLAAKITRNVLAPQ